MKTVWLVLAACLSSTAVRAQSAEQALGLLMTGAVSGPPYKGVVTSTYPNGNGMTATREMTFKTIDGCRYRANVAVDEAYRSGPVDPTHKVLDLTFDFSKAAPFEVELSENADEAMVYSLNDPSGRNKRAYADRIGKVIRVTMNGENLQCRPDTKDPAKSVCSNTRVFEIQDTTLLPRVRNAAKYFKDKFCQGSAF